MQQLASLLRYTFYSFLVRFGIYLLSYNFYYIRYYCVVVLKYKFFKCFWIVKNIKWWYIGCSKNNDIVNIFWRLFVKFFSPKIGDISGSQYKGLSARTLKDNWYTEFSKNEDIMIFFCWIFLKLCFSPKIELIPARHNVGSPTTTLNGNLWYTGCSKNNYLNLNFFWRLLIKQFF